MTIKFWRSTRILGQLLFLIYLNDLLQVLNETRSYLYIDDTCIFYQDKNVRKMEKGLNTEFPSLFKWLIDNKLSIHFGDDKNNFFLSNETPTKTKKFCGDQSLK